jgi:hypothetical protein
VRFDPYRSPFRMEVVIESSEGMSLRILSWKPKVITLKSWQRCCWEFKFSGIWLQYKTGFTLEKSGARILWNVRNFSPNFTASHLKRFAPVKSGVNYILVKPSVISGSLSPRHGESSGCGWRNGLQIWRVAENILNKQSRTADKGWSSSLWVGRYANNSSP